MKLKRSMGLVLLTLLSAAVSAQNANTQAQRLAASCANCHGTNGVPVAGTMPSLAGQSKESIAGKFQAFKAGTAQATVMHQLAKGYTDEQIGLIAEFFSQQAGAPAK